MTSVMGAPAEVNMAAQSTERLLWIFAAGAAVHQLPLILSTFSTWESGLSLAMLQYTVYLPFLVPIGTAVAAFFAVRRFAELRGVAVIGLLVAVGCLFFGFQLVSMHAYIGIGLLIWAVKLRHQFLVWGGVTGVVANLSAFAVHWVGIMRPFTGLDVPRGFEAGGGLSLWASQFATALLIGVAATLVLVALAATLRRRRHLTD